jgi:hypothetical protein
MFMRKRNCLHVLINKSRNTVKKLVQEECYDCDKYNVYKNKQKV